MGLYYKSTRNSNLKVTASEAILKGLARTEDFLYHQNFRNWMYQCRI